MTDNSRLDAFNLGGTYYLVLTFGEEAHIIHGLLHGLCMEFDVANSNTDDLFSHLNRLYIQLRILGNSRYIRRSRYSRPTLEVADGIAQDFLHRIATALEDVADGVSRVQQQYRDVVNRYAHTTSGGNDDNGRKHQNEDYADLCVNASRTLRPAADTLVTIADDCCDQIEAVARTMGIDLSQTSMSCSVANIEPMPRVYPAR